MVDSANGLKGSINASSEKSIAKRKETYKRTGHQQGSKNSQFGTMWISNLELHINKKIPKIDQIPDGWIKGKK